MSAKKSDKLDKQLFYGTCPDMTSAKMLSRALLGAKLVACVNLVPGVCSLYHWEREVQEDSEVVFLAKASVATWEQASRLFCELHPYDEPAFVAFDIASGLPGYLSWIEETLSMSDGE